jgi:hypothetical protein
MVRVFGPDGSTYIYAYTFLLGSLRRSHTSHENGDNRRLRAYSVARVEERTIAITKVATAAARISDFAVKDQRTISSEDDTISYLHNLPAFQLNGVSPSLARVF